MGKKHKHEEHVNHERWVISFADMMTLLFALFVVLYAIGETKLRKLKQVKQSLAFALNFEGSGKTESEGLFDKGQVGGELIEPIPLLNAQKGAMREFLAETLPREFEETTGKSLEIVLTDDTISFKGPLSAYFEPGRVQIRADISTWMADLITATTTFTSKVRVRIEAPDVQISTNQNQTVNRTSVLCHQRNEYLLQFLSRQPRIDPEAITTEFMFMPPSREPWETVGTLTLAFQNQ